MRIMIKKSKTTTFIQYFFGIVVAFFTLAPFTWLFISSISYQKDLTATPLRLVGNKITFQRYMEIFTNPNNDVAYSFKIAMQNSIIIAICVTIVTIIIGSLAAYAFARLRFRFRKKLIYLFLFTYMIPPVVIVIPLYIMLSKLHMLDSKGTLILLYLSSVTPFVIWIMQGYFASISKAFEEAAAIDGCSRIQTLIYIILPIAAPGIIATGIMAFLLCWDEFFLSLIFTSSLKAKTISVAIAEFSGKNAIDYGMIATGGVIASIPPLVISFVFQKYLVKGMTVGGVKE